ncbi:hypothetical protein [Novosphingobium sp.]|uniref:hypothetical protein n=1 Tax=Novosphingobium sp. TaxID=1874826 RepID=UPI0038BBBB3C
MIDIFAVVLHHALMLLAIWRLIQRDDLDSDPLLPLRKSDRFRRTVARGSGKAEQVAPGKAARR